MLLHKMDSPNTVVSIVIRWDTQLVLLRPKFSCTQSWSLQDAQAWYQVH